MNNDGKRAPIMSPQSCEPLSKAMQSMILKKESRGGRGEVLRCVGATRRWVVVADANSVMRADEQSVWVPKGVASHETLLFFTRCAIMNYYHLFRNICGFYNELSCECKHSCVLCEQLIFWCHRKDLAWKCLNLP